MLADNTEFPQKGRIENTLNQVDPKTGTLELQASFPNPQHTLLPGQFGKVRVETELRTQRRFWFRSAPFSNCRAMQTVYTVGAGQQSGTARHHHRRARGRGLDRPAGAEARRSRHRRRPAARCGRA